MSNDNKIDISFIIPIYNIEMYLAECIDSILKQKGVTFEIILVNDGSKDDSLKIAMEYAKNYNNIFVISKENEGVSVARNVGIDKAIGKYICFVDGDDFYRQQFARKLFDISEKYKLDIIRGRYLHYNEKTEVFENIASKIIPKVNTVLNGREYLKESIIYKCNEVVPWLGFFKRKYIVKNNIRFPKGIGFEEDQIFFLETLIKDKKCRIMQVDIPFYSYRIRETSVTNNYSLKQLEDIIWVLKEEYKIINNFLDRKERKYGYKYLSGSFGQFIPIYSFIKLRKSKKGILKKISLSVKLKLILYPYSSKILFKSCLFLSFPNIFKRHYSKKAKR